LKAFDRLMTAFSCWMIAGLYVDGWAHYHLESARESFFTPWHALLYSGFAACAIALAMRTASNHARGSAWIRSVPAGYEFAAVGVVVMALGGVIDMIWHLVFGIETNIAAQLSPAHLILAVGMGMIVSGPFRAASATAKERWPALISLALLLAVFELFSKAFHPFYIPWAGAQWRVSVSDKPLTDEVAYLQQALGVASIVVQTTLLMGLLLIALRRGLLPPGGVTVIVGIGVALFDISLLPAALGGGIIGDLLLWRLRPTPNRALAVRIFAFTVPFCLYALYYADVALTRGGVWWPVHLWGGSIVIAGLTGLLISLLAIPSDTM
jgi:hypothetical protein